MVRVQWYKTYHYTLRHCFEIIVGPRFSEIVAQFLLPIMFTDALEFQDLNLDLAILCKEQPLSPFSGSPLPHRLGHLLFR